VKKLFVELEEGLKKVGIVIKKEELLAPYTTVRIGGACALMVFPKTLEEVKKVFELVDFQGVSSFVLGGGSNLLVGDEGFEGVVVNLRGLKGIKVVEEDEKICKLCIMAGTMVNEVIAFGLKHGYSGLEFLAGVPASMGGAVKMNAGAFGEDMSRLIERVYVWRSGGIEEVLPSEKAWRYREFKEKGVFLEVVLRMKRAPREVIKKRIREFLKERLSKQPLGRRTFGSVFKNPEGDFAGRLIESCGLKGKRIGDACISEKHANFIENLGRAKAEHVLRLMQLAREKVFQHFGVVLEPEVRFLGCEI